LVTEAGVVVAAVATIIITIGARDGTAKAIADPACPYEATIIG
jgi:hypothetical protein